MIVPGEPCTAGVAATRQYSAERSTSALSLDRPTGAVMRGYLVEALPVCRHSLAGGCLLSLFYLPDRLARRPHI
jgi:hypothetical protein